SSDSSIASVQSGNDGTATVFGIGAGDATILVRLGTFRRTIPVEVTEATADRVDVTTDHAMLPLGLPGRLTAMVPFTDGHTADFSDRVVWMSADAMVASVAPDGGVTANALGATEISATFMGLTGKTSIEVTAAKLTEIAITPMPPIAKGLHAQLAA